MSNDQDKLNSIFSQALAKESSAERERYLADVCGQDAELRAEVDALLAAHAEAGDFLRQPIAGVTATAPIVEQPGTVVGRYKLLQQIGEGGFGLVFMAEQQEPMRRMVALKILKAGMDTKEVIARFEAERQALALMDHPNIAKVLDGGATSSGRPFFVMDLVKGIPITEFCDQNQFSTEARLRLFLQVCAAVQHAHQKGIIHRDLKPTNVLVSVSNGEPVPKIIDFGIAKAIGQKLTQQTFFTRFEQLIGTPAYMSPEQAEWGGVDIDTRSDIYSLGVLLYELLTGTTPFEKKTLARAALDEVRRMIRETDPPTPSLRLKGMGQQLKDVARQRQTEPATLTRLVRGELDWIVTKCLDKDRTRRYETASELASDVQRHLQGELVLARPPSALYRLGKVIRQNRLTFAAGGLVVASLVAGLGISTWMFFQERQAKQAQAHLRELADSRQKSAEAQAARAQELARVLKDMLKGARPEVAKGRDTTILREILDSTAARVSVELTNQPQVQVEALGTLLDVYEDLQLYKQMEAVARQRAAIAQASFGEKSVFFADALGGIGRALLHSRRLEESEAYLRKAVALRAQLSGGDQTASAEIMNNLGDVLISQSKWDEAQALYRRLLALQPKTQLSRASLLNNLAVVLRNQGQAAEAEKLQRESVELSLQAEKATLNMVTQLQNLGSQMSAQQRLSEAEKFYREALETSQKLWGDDNEKLWPTARSLVDLLEREKKYDEAEKLFSKLLDGKKERRPEDALLLAGRADYLADRGRWAEAASNLCEAILLKPTNALRNDYYWHLAICLASAGDLSAYRLLDPQLTNMAPAGTFAFLDSELDMPAWQIIDDTRSPAGLNARPLVVLTDPASERIYGAGFGNVDAQGKEVAVIRASSDSGKTWAVLNTWQGGPATELYGFCLAPSGSLFMAGRVCDDPAKGERQTMDWYVRRSMDQGATWTTRDWIHCGTGGKPWCRVVQAAPTGEIYAAGHTGTNQGYGGWAWLVRKSSDDGESWTTVDTVFDRQSVHTPMAIGFGPKGSVFVAGKLHGDITERHGVWTVRRSLDGGATWATVDSYQAAPDHGAVAIGIAVDPSGIVYVAGMASGMAEGGLMTDQWVVRRSADGGATWVTIDDLEIGRRKPENFSALSGPMAMAIAPSGAILVCGYMTPPDNIVRWLVRQGVPSPNGAIHWTTIDNYQMVPGKFSRTNCVTTDKLGNIYVTGRAADASATHHWLTRRLAVINTVEALRK
jgi:tetratricopeptide (TPR) repeat protein